MVALGKDSHMTFRILDITSAETVKVRGGPAFAQVNTQETITMADDEVGIILGKHAFHDRGVGTFGGIVNPGWSGKLTIELVIFNEFEIKKGDKLAHVVVVKQVKQ